MQYISKIMSLNWGQLWRFGVCGGLAWIVDTGVLDLLLYLGLFPLLSKVIAVCVATAFSWSINRNWAFKMPNSANLVKEAFEFALANVIGMIPPLICLCISHYLLGFTSAFADTISANVVGLAFGTITRYFLYKYLVFTPKS